MLFGLEKGGMKDASTGKDCSQTHKHICGQ